jgi:hypothetical protein
MATKQQIAESLEHFEALLVLLVSSDATNEKAIELAKSVHKKHHILFWSKINLSKSNFVFDALDGDDDEFFDVNTQTQSQQDRNQTENAEKKLEKEIEDPCGGPSNSPTVASSGASVALFEDPFKTPGLKDGSKSVKNSQTSTKNAKICPRLTNRGEKCDKKSDCRFSHPSRCSHFAKFGIVSDFPKGKGCSWEAKCRFAHVKVCKKTTCPKVNCNLTHLQPKPVLPSRNQSGSQANHKRVQQRSNQDHVPCAAGSLEKNSECSSSGLGSRNECSQRPNINNTKGVQQSPFLGQGPHALGDLIRTLSTLVAQFQVPQAPQSQHWKQPSQESSRLSPGTLDVGCCQNCQR